MQSDKWSKIELIQAHLKKRCTNKINIDNIYKYFTVQVQRAEEFFRGRKFCLVINNNYMPEVTSEVFQSIAAYYFDKTIYSIKKYWIKHDFQLNIT